MLTIVCVHMCRHHDFLQQTIYLSLEKYLIASVLPLNSTRKYFRACVVLLIRTHNPENDHISLESCVPVASDLFGNTAIVLFVSVRGESERKPLTKQ